MSEFTDKEILDFAKNNLVFNKDDNDAMQLVAVLCDVYGDIGGDVFSVVGDVGIVSGDVSSVVGDVGIVSGDVGIVGGDVYSLR